MNKQSKIAVQQVQDLKLPLEESEYDELETNHVNIIDHYPVYYAMFILQVSSSDAKDANASIFAIKDFQS